MNNIIKWNNTDIINWYNSRTHIQDGEKKIIEIIDFSKIKNMLDIGVGGGRTTYYFKDLVKKYKGIDIAPKFIESCKNKFKNIDFECLNVLDITKQNINYDFILFSHNGIDNLLNHDEYLKAIKICLIFVIKMVTYAFLVIIFGLTILMKIIKLLKTM